MANIPNIPSEIKEGIDKGDLDVVLGDYESVTARDTEFIAGLTGSGAVANKAGKAAWDRFGKKPSEVTSDVTKIDNPAIEVVKDKDSAANVALYEKYKKELSNLEISSLFNKDGTLTKEAIKLGKPLSGYTGDKLGNVVLKENLIKDGSNLTDWNKKYIELNGNRQLHYYENKVTGKIYYDMDYKIKLPDPKKGKKWK